MVPVETPPNIPENALYTRTVEDHALLLYSSKREELYFVESLKDKRWSNDERSKKPLFKKPIA
jgi:hypothetical protein